MLCTQSSGKKTIGILADPKTRIGGILQWVELAACKAPLPLVLSFWLTLPHCRSVQYKPTDMYDPPPAPVSNKISTGMRGRTRLECHAVPCTQSCSLR